MQELLERAVQGDTRALARLLMDHRRLVGVTVGRLLWDRSRCKDVVQNVFVKALQGLPKFSGGCRFSTWLYRIAVNEAVEQNRRHARERLFMRMPDGAVFADPDAADGLRASSDAELRRDVHEALAGLAEELREAFELFYGKGYSGKQAAGLAGITEASFFMRLKRARDHVREYLRERGWHT
ncbi:MAG: sigma-70 family RNA polymerase sigma factor [Chitinivibrionales bacterium]|nr:sigma-70 family RNA polymerase sigma factor [Chitinivibrionales bacterium]